MKNYAENTKRMQEFVKNTKQNGVNAVDLVMEFTNCNAEINEEGEVNTGRFWGNGDYHDFFNWVFFRYSELEELQ